MLKASNIFTLLKTSEELLTLHNIKEAKLDAEVLLCSILNIKRSKLFTMRSDTLTQIQLKQYQKYLERRSNREPLAYILGKTEFMGLEFNVNSNVLIPRQETELLVEEVNNQIKINNYKEILDMCTGSGCIAISVAYEKDVLVTAADISKEAIDIAVGNSRINKVSSKIEFLISNMFDNIKDKKFDIIISNPPYITREEFKTLEEELLFEPKNALVAEDDGLFFYNKIAEKSKEYLNNNGIIVLELNSNISQKIVELFEIYGFIKIKIIKDYANLDRVLVLKNG
ncbi:MAG: peptide chain release factor N(5)-glutamine methyltransferase [Endomicrobiia bacterium]|nr:peptide chain release factor N(5)-glutamine methyltransferase [Endomicrobiaceae bacterium]MDD3053500.1 peptide chain release factor N(5)-glutamine methyltransferase [Endomicrobiaceae bacterium]MDD3922439.1 peptide chain release factor N(5)-glutamine methyltransferase [Endomicrobiaceae bacterium]